MSPKPTIDLLDENLLAELYDERSLARGRAYASEERAAIISSTPGEIKAVCVRVRGEPLTS